jgi:hypothetical protein
MSTTRIIHHVDFPSITSGYLPTTCAEYGQLHRTDSIFSQSTGAVAFFGRGHSWPPRKLLVSSHSTPLARKRRRPPSPEPESPEDRARASSRLDRLPRQLEVSRPPSAQRPSLQCMRLQIPCDQIDSSSASTWKRKRQEAVRHPPDHPLRHHSFPSAAAEHVISLTLQDQSLFGS